MDVLTERSSRVVSFAKLHRAAERRDQRRFLIEGANAVTAAIETGRAQIVLVGEDAAPRHHEVVALAESRGLDVLWLTERAVDKLADATTPPGVFAVCSLLDTSVAEVLADRPRLLAVAVEPREPGNLGTIIRCADAMGADGVVVLGDAVDPHNGKCVRASAGSVFHLPIARERNAADGLDALRGAGLALLATTADGDVALPGAASILAKPTAWLFGNEAHGLPDEIVAAADHRVSIPIKGRAESLNLATAAAICLYASSTAQG
ncbi:TrmH family RNA methyltransferase [Gordonia crocea]|uniref:rRNA methylase n=1 Tax=Gordonia crocea TaxID=589162 RepID=A0A7I9UXS9_9ACTN|nr:RNA methyltransferase [Gordonia crocea]GED97719.1 rRNA methylase [Gordonia crocea]